MSMNLVKNMHFVIIDLMMVVQNISCKKASVVTTVLLLVIIATTVCAQSTFLADQFILQGEIKGQDTEKVVLHL
jgi:hypothetical protein